MARTVTESPGSGGVDVGVFGAVRVRVDGVVVDLGRRQVRQLVSALVARAGWVVSADTLIDHLWPQDLPAHPRKALNVALSRLRSALGDGAHRLVAEGDGYRLDANRIDIDRFVAGVESARDLGGRASIEALEAALALWMGEPFADDVDAAIVASRRASLHELRWFVLTRLTELYVDEGEPERAVVLSAPLLDDDVVRERLVIAHAVALARCGRKSEALEVTGRAVAALRNSQGLEPSVALIEAERRILDGATDLVPLAGVATRPLADVFVGRVNELALLDRVKPGFWASVVAEAGTGKSTLLDRFEADRTAAGTEVYRVDVSPTPDRPLDAAARLCLVLVERRGVAHVAGEYRAALGRVCPELGFERSTALTRDAMVDDIVRFIESEARRAVVVIDDAHRLDGGSAEIFEKIVRRERAAVVFGSRPSDDPKLAFLAAAATSGGARALRLDLAPLSRADVAELAASMSGRALTELELDRLNDRAGGNALFLRLLLDRWCEGGAIDGELPSSVLVSVSQRLDTMSRSAVQTLEMAAAVGRSFPIHALRQLRPNADADLASAAGADLLSIDSTTDTGAFVHALVAETCYQRLSDGRRVSIHDELGRALEIDAAPAAEYARHYVAAAALDPTRAVWSCLSAAGDFIVGFDWPAAADFVALAEVVARDSGVDDVDLLAQIAVRRGTIGRAMSSDGYVDDLLRGCELARAADNDVLFAIAVAELCGHGQTTAAGGVDERVLPLLREALDLEVGPGVRAELCAAAAPLFSMSNGVQRGRALYREAWDIAIALGDREVEAAVVASAHLGFSHPDDFDLLVEASERMAALAGNDPELIWESAFVRFQCSVILGDPVAAHEALDQMRLYTPLVTHRPRDFGLAFTESAHAALIGDLEAAELHATDALTVGLERFDESWATTIYGLLLLTVRAEQGRLDELAGLINAAAEASPDYLPFRALASMIATDAGDAAAAREHLDAVAVDGFARLEPDLHYTAVITLLAHAVAFVGRPDEIDTLSAKLAPFSGRMSWNAASSSGPVDAALARLAAARGDDVAAARYQSSADALVASFRSNATVGSPVQTASG